MTDYTKAVDFAAKDALTTGDPDKIIKGTEFDTEFNNIATAVATKADRASPTFTGTVNMTSLTLSGTLTATGTINFTSATISNGGTVTTIDINGGTIDNAIIGGTTPANGTFTNLTADDAFTDGILTFYEDGGATNYKTQMYHSEGTGFTLVTMDYAGASPDPVFYVYRTTGEMYIYAGIELGSSASLMIGHRDNTLDMGASTGVFLTNGRGLGNANSDITLECTGVSSSGDINMIPGQSGGLVKGVVRGSGITGDNGVLSCVTALPGTPDADTIYFVV